MHIVNESGHAAAEAVRNCATEIATCLNGGDDPLPGQDRIVAAIKRLLERDDLREIGMARAANHAHGSWILYYDPKLMIVLGDTRKDKGDTAPHNHGSWLATAVYSGRVRCRSYTRVDDGTKSGVASLRLVGDRVLNGGDVVVSGPVPHDIHQVERLSEAYNLLVVTGGNMARVRQYYDVEQGTCVEQVVE